MSSITKPSFANPMTAVGDVIVGTTAGAASRQAHPGAANRVLKSTSTTALGYAQIVNADVDASAAIAGTKVDVGTSSTRGTVKWAEELGSSGSVTNTSNVSSVTVTRTNVTIGDSIVIMTARLAFTLTGAGNFSFDFALPVTASAANTGGGAAWARNGANNASMGVNVASTTVASVNGNGTGTGVAYDCFVTMLYRRA